MRPAFVLLFVAAALVVAVNAQGRGLLAPSTCSAATGRRGSETAYRIRRTSGNSGTICFDITPNDACDSTKDCCPIGAANPPKFKSLLLTPPAGSSCAKAELRKLIKWTVGSAKPKTGRTDGTVMTVNIAGLDPEYGGLVCVDLSATKDANCQAYENLCKSGRSCGIALKTGKYQKAKGKPSVDCCSAAYGGQTPVADCTDTPPGTACIAQGKLGACLIDKCDPSAVLDCTDTTGFVRCSIDGVLVGTCCTPQNIRDKQCTAAQAGACVSVSDVKSCEGVSDSRGALCETPEYISMCNSGACVPPVADCTGLPDDTPCRYGDVKIFGDCSENKCDALLD